ncbi:MAG: hypothetical protein DCC55_25280 [Chloroflexi bacterium]|nr:MAG: hypothetical protein DCC55_25280 [Chloroflexota bacterium]
MTIKELQEQARELRAAQGWLDTSLEHRIMFLVTEVGEVVNETLKLVGATKQYSDSEVEQIKANLGLELYDVLWNLCDLANLAGIDLEAAFAKKVAINRTRKW